MHIVLLNDDFPLEGGSSVAHLTNMLAEGLRGYNHRVTVVTTHRKEDTADVLAGEGDSIVSIPVSYRASLRHYVSLYNPRVSKTLQKVFDRLKPDVVHAHNIHQYLTYDALKIAHQYTPKVFLTCHDVMSIAYGRLTTDTYLKSEGKKVSLSFVDHIRTAGLQYNPLRNIIIRKKIRNNVKQVVAVSNALQHALETNGMKDVAVIRNGSDPTYWQADANAIETCRIKHNLQDRKIILFAGRLRRDKGTTPLLQALDIVRRSVPEVLLLVVGERERWEGLVKEARVPDDLQNHYKCTGWMSHEELAAAYGASDVVVTPSLCLDTFNLINLEAMANAKPVVGTLFGGTPEVVVDGVTGFIRNPLKVEDFATALITVLKDDQLAAKMGQAGHDRAAEKFTIQTMTDAYLKLYTS